MTAHELVHDLGRAYRECRLGKRKRTSNRARELGFLRNFRRQRRTCCFSMTRDPNILHQGVPQDNQPLKDAIHL